MFFSAAPLFQSRPWRPSASLWFRHGHQPSQSRPPSPAGCVRAVATSPLQQLVFFPGWASCSLDGVRQTSRQLRLGSVVVLLASSHPWGRGTRSLREWVWRFRGDLRDEIFRVCGPCSQICCLLVRHGRDGWGRTCLRGWSGPWEDLLAPPSPCLWDLGNQ